MGVQNTGAQPPPNQAGQSGGAIGPLGNAFTGGAMPGMPAQPPGNAGLFQGTPQGFWGSNMGQSSGNIGPMAGTMGGNGGAYGAMDRASMGSGPQAYIPGVTGPGSIHPQIGSPRVPPATMGSAGMPRGASMAPPNYGGVPRPLVGGALPGGAPAASPVTSPVMGNTQNIQASGPSPSPQALGQTMQRMGYGGFNRG